jgi:DNA modification methylase
MTLHDEYGVVYEDEEILEVAKSLGYFVPDVPEGVSEIDEATGDNWGDFQDISTNSLWIIESRSREGMHDGKYHGNFVPQIPYQAIRRFTKPGDIVLDPFVGSGTTLIEARRQGRHGIGIELIDTIAGDARRRIDAEANPHNTWQKVIVGDSTSEATIVQVRKELQARGHNQVQLLVMHPPYHDIIKFSDDPQDLCNARTLEDFLESFKKVVRGTYNLLEKNHFLVVVIGDKYRNREWIPLGFLTMETVRSVGYTLKSIVVKNMEGNRAKRNLERLWRQRAFKGKYYIFKHEYIFFFQKAEIPVERLRKVADFVRAIDHREELNLIKDSSFVSGEELSDIIRDFTWITPSELLALKNGQMRAVVLDLTGVNVTRDVEEELEQFIGQLPDKVVDVSVLAASDQRASLQRVQGVSQVYSPDDESLEQLAHAMYVVRKATGSPQRAGRAAAVAFATSLNAALEKLFEPNVDYHWLPRGGISFKFFKTHPDRPFGEVRKGTNNFEIGIVTKWVNGHENEKMPQIRDRYLDKGFVLVAVVGPNVDAWKSEIEKRGNFADFYLFVDKGKERSLEQVVQKQPLVRANGEKGIIAESELTLAELLQRRKLAGEHDTAWSQSSLPLAKSDAS